MAKTLFLICLLFLLAGIAVASERPARAVIAAVDADGVQRVEIVGGGYYFDPFHITVRVGTPVELVARKDSGIVPHDIVLRAPEAGIEFEEGLSAQPKTIRFTPTKTGTYSFYCSKRLLFFESHQDRGMEGILEVID
jgi:plastocyanin